MAKAKLHNIDDKTLYTDAYRGVGACGEAFFLFATSIPKNLGDNVKKIHSRLDDAAYFILKASNTYDLAKKVENLDAAYERLFALQSSFYYLTKSHGVTISQANTVIDLVRSVYEQVDSWKKKILEKMPKPPSESSGREVR